MANGAGLEAAIIVASLDNGENVQLQQAFDRAGIPAPMLLLEDIAIRVAGKPDFQHPVHDIDHIPGFVIRGIGFTTFARSFFRVDLLYALEQHGKILINGARATETAMNKSMASVTLDAEGIPTPATIVTENLNHALATFDALGGDVIVKPVYGSQGTGIFRIQDKGFAEHVFFEMFRNGLVFYVQQFHPWSCPPDIDASNPFDVRVLVINGEIVGSMIREGSSDDAWKTNVHQGATPRPYTPSDEVAELAINAARALQLDVAGVDLLHSALTEGWVVLETNACPGWTGLSKVCDVDVPGKIVDFYCQKLAL
ncbi:MAG TPA: RimK family alpha-L-glutamate ligase [Candidatus Lokiarchaeia archaeon]|nr:RimK family alpha-L-glutamate ligase [Candidatus Lokiarchaeia archaeon]